MNTQSILLACVVSYTTVFITVCNHDHLVVVVYYR